MACGKRIESHYYNNHQLADAVRDSGEFNAYSMSKRIERGECLEWAEMKRVERALEENLGAINRLDYRERDCYCD